MAEQRTEFAYNSVELYKSESLGSGSYGAVCKAKCDGLPCAAKIMHPTLFDLRDPGVANYMSRFREECHLLSLARHPNVVQYLGTCSDPDTRLPVLLMELCDESLTAFLERSPGPLSYHIQVNICNDIALALVYLHSNGFIHRDLTGNNVLMLPGPRAKITDFGVSKLANINPSLKVLSFCPGNDLYMSPEALDEGTLYTAKLDVFSFGVIVIQILTRQFPNPTKRFRNIQQEQHQEKEVRAVVPETERRQAHLQLIHDTHSLKPLALQCLRRESLRPSALRLSNELWELKQSAQYTESLHQTRSIGSAEYPTQISGLERVVAEKNGQLQEQQHTIQAKEGQLRESVLQCQQMQEQIQSSEKLASEFQHRLQLKEETINDLQRTILAHERKIQQLKQPNQPSRNQPQQDPVTAPQAADKEMRWREGESAPEEMFRGAAIVHGQTAYFRPAYLHKVYCYQNISGKEQWSRLPDNPYVNFGLTVIDGLITSVGGRSNDVTNMLLSLKGEGAMKQWLKIVPPMVTPRRSAACITTEQALVVAGGRARCCGLDTVEVMNIDTKEWTTVAPLPLKCWLFSATLCRGAIYLAGGLMGHLLHPSKSVITCSLHDLLPPAIPGSGALHPPSHNVWREISSLPVKRSTLASFGGDLLAIGGDDDFGKPTSNVYRYDSHNDSWTVASRMKSKRSDCLAVSLSAYPRVVVVGGITDETTSSHTSSIEVLQ